MLSLALILIITLQSIEILETKSVHMTLQTKWSNVPLLSESSEFFAKENSKLFWRYVEETHNAKILPTWLERNDFSQYERVLMISRKLLSTIKFQLLRFSLSIRSNAPVIEMYRQLALAEEPNKCANGFAVFNGDIYCDKSRLERDLSFRTPSNSLIYRFDHIFKNNNPNKIVVLYAQLGTSFFLDFHSFLSSRKDLTYIFRHFTINFKNHSLKRVILSGYGVELAIKSQEYKAKDESKLFGSTDVIQGFDFTRLRSRFPSLKNKLGEFRQFLVDGSKEIASLKAWQLQSLSIQAVTKAMNQSSPVETLNYLRKISTNFPSLARSLIRVKTDQKMVKEMKQNQAKFEEMMIASPGEALLLINGLNVDIDAFDIFTTLSMLRDEAKLMEKLYDMDIKDSVMMSLMKIPLKSEFQDYSLDIRTSSIQYINDLEHDPKYSRWPKSVTELLRLSFPGMMKQIAKNLFHLIFIINPADKHSYDLVKMAEAFYVHSAPVRIGFLFVTSDKRYIDGNEYAAVAVYRAFNYIATENSPPEALSFLTDVYSKTDAASDVTSATVVNFFKRKYSDADFELVFGADSDYDYNRIPAYEYYRLSGLSDLPQVLLNGVPFKMSKLVDDFEEVVVTRILKETQNLAEMAYEGKLRDSHSVLDVLMEQENVVPRLNSRIVDISSSSYISFEPVVNMPSIDNFHQFSLLHQGQFGTVISSDLKYLMKYTDEYQLRTVSMWVVCDIETPDGRDLFLRAIKHIKSSKYVRIGLIFNPRFLDIDRFPISRAAYAALKVLPSHIARLFVVKLLKESTVEGLNSGEISLANLEVSGMDMEEYKSTLESLSLDFLKSHHHFVENELNFKSGQMGIVVNGRIIGPLRDDEQFMVGDYHLLDKFTHNNFAKVIHNKLEIVAEKKLNDDLVMKVTAVLMSQLSHSTVSKRTSFDYHSDSYSVLKLTSPNPDIPAYDVIALVDPLSRAAQKLFTILKVLYEVVNVNIKVFMNSRHKLSEMPLRAFYRYVLQPERTFDADGNSDSSPIVSFNDVPEDPLFTLNVLPPEGWLVEAVESIHDLDNIYLAEVEKNVKATYELEYQLIEGHCFDSDTGQPPRGLQFVTGINSSSLMFDTIVMANLGYFQLKSNPGVWFLRLRDGRSREIYDIVSHDLTDSPQESRDVITAVNSFSSRVIKIRVAKKRNKQKESLLAEDTEKSESIWSTITNTFIGKKSSPGDIDKTLNIFSLASGHLYERLMRIMMISLLRHTNSNVKFWFLKNYMSPSFKKFLPIMAKKYSFQYELVQYKWPRWLHQQSEKQRIIWGYKILFLDVLFPLDVKKIIFVDADLTVRTDMQELYDFDLEGNPYGYTPFCSSRTEMDGFRFWKGGYWESHLDGRPYHISALYVVDLKKFRQIAAGDRLRGQYQGLSQDPNSLSNLDQDLPNNMIHQVGIKSLPQEWLYCETWCSDSEKSRAKTIDLCNNPMTKEPKLDAARRIVPEWTDYDNELREFWNSVFNTTISDELSNDNLDILHTEL